MSNCNSKSQTTTPLWEPFFIWTDNSQTDWQPGACGALQQQQTNTLPYPYFGMICPSHAQKQQRQASKAPW